MLGMLIYQVSLWIYEHTTLFAVHANRYTRYSIYLFCFNKSLNRLAYHHTQKFLRTLPNYLLTLRDFDLKNKTANLYQTWCSTERTPNKILLPRASMLLRFPYELNSLPKVRLVVKRALIHSSVSSCLYHAIHYWT